MSDAGLPGFPGAGMGFGSPKCSVCVYMSLSSKITPKSPIVWPGTVQQWQQQQQQHQLRDIGASVCCVLV